MNEIIYRPAHPSDAPQIAQLIIDASGGMMEFLFQDPTGERSTCEIVTSFVESDAGLLSYCNNRVAALEELVVGVANFYPALSDAAIAQLEEMLPKERWTLVENLVCSRVENSLFLNALSVLSNYRDRGIGSELIQFVKEKAIAEGFKSVSLMVLVDNKNAQRLYHRQGFEPVKPVAIGAHPLLPHENGLLLMNYPLSISAIGDRV